LGFLTEVSASDMIAAVDSCFSGEARVERRMMLRADLRRGGRTRATFSCLNDVVVAKTALARMIDIRVDVGGGLLTTMRCDGIIVATPTGSSGYSISAGGPLIYPELNVFALTPICPFLHAFRPMVLPFENDLRVLVLDADVEVFLTQDGQTGVVLAPGDNIFASRAEQPLQLIRPLHSHYAHKLKSKGFVRES